MSPSVGERKQVSFRLCQFLFAGRAIVAQERADRFGKGVQIELFRVGEPYEVRWRLVGCFGSAGSAASHGRVVRHPQRFPLGGQRAVW
jgi:hypothetical protein